MLKALDGGVRGMFCVGQNPAVGSANSKLMRLALAKLDWLVVRDFQPTESAMFWKDSPEHETGEIRAQDIQTEVFFLPAAAHTEKDGNFTNTQRLLQWHHKAVRAAGRRALGAALDLPPRQGRARQARGFEGPEGPADPRPDLGLPARRRARRARRRGRAAGDLRPSRRRSFLSSYDDLEPDGSTSCGSWIHCGIYDDGVNQSARKKPGTEQNWIAHEWGWAWPKDVRILYNRASADPEGKPWSERKRYVWWDADEGNGPVSATRRTFPPTKAPDYRPATPSRWRRSAATSRSSCTRTGAAGCSCRRGWSTARCQRTTSRRSRRSATRCTRRSKNPTRQVFPRPENPYHPGNGEPGAEVFPFVLTTYRLTEHHTAGGMSRTVPYLSELQPEFFCEISPQLAAERGLEHGGWATIVTARQAVEARVLVTERIKPLQIQGRALTSSGAPYHWGGVGIVTGDSANELLPVALDNNVHISEYKAATCDIRPGRRPRGPERLALVQEYRRRAGVDSDHRDDRLAVQLRRRGQAPQGVLHRHLAVHRLQGVRGGVQGVEPDPDVEPGLHRQLLRQHGRSRRRHLASRRVHRAARARGRPGRGLAGAGGRSAARRSTPASRPTRRGRRGDPLADGLRRLQALHARGVPGGVPDGRPVPHRVRHGRGPGGRLQRLRLLRAGVSVRRDRPARGRWPRLEVHALLRPPQGRHGARVRARLPHRLDPVRGSVAAARARRASARAPAGRRAVRRAAVSGRRGRRNRRRGRVLPAARRSRGLRPSPGPGRPRRDLGEIWTAAAAAAVALGAGLAAAVFGGRR